MMKKKLHRAVVFQWCQLSSCK